jgi:hypothetical protein
MHTIRGIQAGAGDLGPLEAVLAAQRSAPEKAVKSRPIAAEMRI